MSGVSRSLSRAWYRGDDWLLLLKPLEWLYLLVVAFRRQLYQRGFLTVYRPDVPVVVVGNITTGGTGKTPVVIALVEALQSRGFSVGVVSRGYGSQVGNQPHVVGEGSHAIECGDEPLMIHRRTGAPCVVCPDRVAAVKTLVQSFHVDLVISDDGLQHLALGRSLEIAMLDAELGMGNGFCLPAGPLREPPGRLTGVDFVLRRGGDAGDDSVTFRADKLVNLLDGMQVPPCPGKVGSEVYAIAGIARPEHFANTLRDLGFEPELVEFPDHHVFSAKDLHLPGVKPLIMTEKDAVKCAEFASADTWYLRIQAELPARLVDSVAALANN